MFGFARIALGTLLREATRVCPAPKRRSACFFGRFGKSFFRVLCGLPKRFSESRNPQGGEAEAERRVPHGRGISTERVTEGEQGKSGRDGALWKHFAEGHLHKDAARDRAATEPFAAARHASGCKSREWVNHALRWSASSSPHPAMRRTCVLGDGVEGELHGSSVGSARARRRPASLQRLGGARQCRLHVRVPAHPALSLPCRSRRMASTAAMRCPIQRMTGTAIELPSAL